MIETVAMVTPSVAGAGGGLPSLLQPKIFVISLTAPHCVGATDTVAAVQLRLSQPVKCTESI